MRRLAVALVLVSAIAGATAVPSFALTRPNPAFNADGTLTTSAWATLTDAETELTPVSVGGVTQSASTVDTVVESGRIAGRITPNISAIATVAGKGIGIVAAGYTAYKVTRPVGNWIARKIFGNDGSPAGAGTIVPGKWVRVTGFSSSFGPGCPTYCWQVDATNGNFYGYSATGSADYVDFTPTWVNWNRAVTGATVTTVNAGSSCPAGGVSNPNCVFNARSDQQMIDHTTIQNISQATYNATPSGQQADLGTYTQPTFTSGDKAATAAVFGTPGSQTPAQAGAEAALAHTVDPTYDPDAPISLFAPSINETYTDYVTRLRAAGFYGTITEHTLSSAEPGYGPSSPTRVQTHDHTGTVRTLDPLRWPATLPVVAPGQSIDIWDNPSSAEPAAEPTDTPPDTIPPAGTLDFTPITGLAPGCKFPYGLLCYAHDVTEWFNVTPTAPDFTFTIPGISVGGSTIGASSYTYDVSLAFFSTYMGWIRALISVCLWVGAVYYLAAKFLGFGAAGDPSEAIDEAL